MTTTLELARPARDREAVRAWIEVFPDAAELARALANTDFVPRAMRGKAAEITAAILYGDEVGLGPMQSLARVSVIDGRPALSAEAQRALIYAAGHELWTVEASVTSATVAGRRRGSDEVVTVTWTMDDARRANLAGRGAWRTYPRQMLIARASAEMARTLFPDAIGGLSATEELEAPDQDAAAALPTGSETEHGPEPTRKRARRGRATTPIAAVTAAPEPPPMELPPLPGEEGAPLMSDGQRRHLMAAFRERGLGGREHQAERHAYASTVVGHPVESSSALTADEAAQVLAVLQAELQAGAAPPSDPAVHPDQMTIEDAGA